MRSPIKFTNSIDLLNFLYSSGYKIGVYFFLCFNVFDVYVKLNSIMAAKQHKKKKNTVAPKVFSFLRMHC